MAQADSGLRTFKLGIFMGLIATQACPLVRCRDCITTTVWLPSTVYHTKLIPPCSVRVGKINTGHSWCYPAECTCIQLLKCNVFYPAEVCQDGEEEGTFDDDNTDTLNANVSGVSDGRSILGDTPVALTRTGGTMITITGTPNIKPKFTVMPNLELTVSNATEVVIRYYDENGTLVGQPITVSKSALHFT